MTPKELAEIEGRLKAATPGPWVAPCGALGTDVRTLSGASVADDVKRANDADFIAHAPTDIARLLAEVRRLTPAVKVARWEAGADDYEECTVLRDPATDAVLGWYNRHDYGECIWGKYLIPGAKGKVAGLATKNGWEVRDGE